MTTPLIEAAMNGKQTELEVRPFGPVVVFILFFFRPHFVFGSVCSTRVPTPMRARPAA